MVSKTQVIEHGNVFDFLLMPNCLLLENIFAHYNKARNIFYTKNSDKIQERLSVSSYFFKTYLGQLKNRMSRQRLWNMIVQVWHKQVIPE